MRSAVSASAAGSAISILPSFPIVNGSSPRMPESALTSSLTGSASSESVMETPEAAASSLATVASPPLVMSRMVWTGSFAARRASTR